MKRDFDIVKVVREQKHFAAVIVPILGHTEGPTVSKGE